MDECGAGRWCSGFFIGAGRMGALDIDVGRRCLQPWALDSGKVIFHHFSRRVCGSLKALR